MDNEVTLLIFFIISTQILTSNVLSILPERDERSLPWFPFFLGHSTILITLLLSVHVVHVVQVPCG